jgi:hypothetical protein
MTGFTTAPISGTYIKVYHCEEHKFTTTDPQSAMLHVDGHAVDLLFDAAKKYIKMRLGIPDGQQRPKGYQL